MDGDLTCPVPVIQFVKSLLKTSLSNPRIYASNVNVVGVYRQIDVKDGPKIVGVYVEQQWRTLRLRSGRGIIWLVPERSLLQERPDKARSY